MDKPSSEQQVCRNMVITFTEWKTTAKLLVLLGFTVCYQLFGLFLEIDMF